MKLGFIFAGQGQQFLYMGQDLVKEYPLAKELYNQATDILGKDILNLTQDELNQTENTQVALFTLSYVLYKILEANGIKPEMVAGLSLGEYNALCAAEVLDFKSALKLIQKRAHLMAQAFEPYETGMAACLRTDRETISQLIKDTGIELCNVNTPTQIVIGGKTETLTDVLAHLKENKVRAIPLKVSTVSHMSLLKDESKKLKEVLETVSFQKPTIPFINNVAAEFQETNFEDTLSRQISETTEMAKTIERMLENNVTHIVEIGPKNTITKFVKEINKETKTINVFDFETVKESIIWKSQS